MIINFLIEIKCLEMGKYYRFEIETRKAYNIDVPSLLHFTA